MPATGANTSNGIPVKIMQCPSDTRSSLIADDNGFKAALTAYLGVNGRNQFRETFGQDGILFVNGGVRITGIKDGTSNTLLVGERPPSTDLYFGWMWAGSGESPYFGTMDVVLGVREIIHPPHNPEAVVTPAVTGQNKQANADFYRPGALVDPNGAHRFHFWSLHTGGGNWLMADGGVRFITYSAGTQFVGDYGGITGVTLLEAMASRAGGEVFSNQ
jgi:prepilin-type processing-associated H-X9-DG protein